jgi:hypothetical protein
VLAMVFAHNLTVGRANMRVPARIQTEAKGSIACVRVQCVRTIHSVQQQNLLKLFRNAVTVWAVVRAQAVTASRDSSASRRVETAKRTPLVQRLAQVRVAASTKRVETRAVHRVVQA